MLVFKSKYQRSAYNTCTNMRFICSTKPPPMSSSMPVCPSLSCWEELTSQLSQAIIRRECDGSVYEAAEAGGKVNPRCGQDFFLRNCWLIRMVMIYTEEACHGIIQMLIMRYTYSLDWCSETIDILCLNPLTLLARYKQHSPTSTLSSLRNR